MATQHSPVYRTTATQQLINTMNEAGPAKPITAAEHEIISLNHSISALEKENGFLKDFMITQEQKLSNFEHQTGWDKFNDSLTTLGEHRIDDAISKLVKLRHLRDKRHAQQGRIRHDANRKRRSTLPGSLCQPEIKAQQRGFRRVDSVAALAGRFTSLFKKKRKGKNKNKVRDDTAESVTSDAIERANKVMAEWEVCEKLDQDYVQLLVEEQKTKSVITREKAIVGEHEQAVGWNLEIAQEEFKKSTGNEKTTFPVRKDSIKGTILYQNSGKESMEVENDLAAAMEKDFLATSPHNRTSTRTVQWPMGSRITGSIFEVPHPAAQGPPLPKLPSQPRLPRAVSTQAMSTQPLPQQTLPPPSRPPPTIPHQSRPRQAQPAPVPARDTSDVFRFSRPATPPSQATPTAQNSRLQRLRHRRSVLSPTPRFVTHRPASPSPGGNEPMPANPVPSWLKTRKGKSSD